MPQGPKRSFSFKWTVYLLAGLYPLYERKCGTNSRKHSAAKTSWSYLDMRLRKKNRNRSVAESSARAEGDPPNAKWSPKVVPQTAFNGPP
jgi:hypothetical protein